MALSDAIEQLKTIDGLVKGIVIPTVSTNGQQNLVDQLINILRREDNNAQTIALLINQLIVKYKGRAV